ncbi:MAG: hypothetical protein AB1651_02665 [Pseudomonadota bacterium]
MLTRARSDDSCAVFLAGDFPAAFLAAGSFEPPLFAAAFFAAIFFAGFFATAFLEAALLAALAPPFFADFFMTSRAPYTGAAASAGEVRNDSSETRKQTTPRSAAAARA